MARTATILTIKHGRPQLLRSTLYRKPSNKAPNIVCEQVTKKFTSWWLARARRGPMSHSLVNSGRVEFENRLVTGMAPIAIALMREMHPVSEDNHAEAAGNQVVVGYHSTASRILHAL